MTNTTHIFPFDIVEMLIDLDNFGPASPDDLTPCQLAVMDQLDDQGYVQLVSQHPHAKIERFRYILTGAGQTRVAGFRALFARDEAAVSSVNYLVGEEVPGER